MRRVVVISSLVFAWLCANGAVWDVAQFLAWTRMFTGYSASLPVGAALRETFDAKKPCRLCRAIARAKTEQQKQAGAQAGDRGDKLILACEVPSRTFLTNPPVTWPNVASATIEPRVEPVPLPPPRA